MDSSMLMLAMMMGGGTLGGTSGGVDTQKLMAQMMTSGTARELIKVNNYQATGNIMYLLF